MSETPSEPAKWQESPRARRLRRTILILGVLLVMSVPLSLAVLAVEMARANNHIAELEAKLKECKP